MADFDPCFEQMIRNEGGYRLHTVKGDRGGMTYAGIARNFHSGWDGWAYLDRGDQDDPRLTELVRDFYREKYWQPLQGDRITLQGVAATLFDFGVNAGTRTAIKLAQLVIGATPDGIVGDRTLAGINKQQSEDFALRYAIAKIGRYATICNRDRGQSKFLLGWINRTLKGVAA